MLVFHSLWDAEKFYIWAESSLLPLSTRRTGKAGNKQARPHPFALEGSDLSYSLFQAFPEIKDMIHDRVEIQTLHLRLPAGSVEPLPSPWLLRDDFMPEKPSYLADCTVSALALDPGQAADLLLDLPLQPQPATAYADSMRFWSQLTLFSLELVSRQQFLPALQGEQVRWRAALDPADEESLGIFVASIPPGCLCLMPQKSPPASPSRLVKSFLDCSLDFLVRSSIRDSSFVPARRGRPPKSASKPSPLPRQFLQALLSQKREDAILKAPQGELAEFAGLLRSWTEALQPRAAESPFKTCFRLQAPGPSAETLGEAEEGEEEGQEKKEKEHESHAGSDSERLWRLCIFLQSKDDQSLLLPAREVWQSRSSALNLLKKRLKDPQEQLLSDLGRAERLYSRLGECLETARPEGISLNTSEAYSFLRDAAPLLEKNGFRVLLPSWWQRPGQGLGINLQLKDSSKKTSVTGQPFLGLDSLVEYDWQLSLGGSPISQDEFLQLSRLKVPLVRIRGEWTYLRPQEIEEAIAFFQKNSGCKMTLAQALRLALDRSARQRAGSDTSLPVLGISAKGRIEEMLKALSRPAHSLEPAAPPRHLQGTLRPYQLRGVSWLEYLHRLGLGACLADDMGLGKTVELIAFLLRQKEETAAGKMVQDDSPPSEQGGHKPTLLICPLSVAGNWQREMERFAPSLRVLLHHGQNRLSGSGFLEESRKKDVIITTYALAARDKETLSTIPWSHLVLDEAQAIKNQSARQTRSIKSLSAGYRIALTGTPVENRLSELWSIMDFLNPGYLGSSTSFHRDFILPIEKYRDKGSRESLRSIIQPFILRRLKTDPTVIRDLPDKLEMKVNYNLTQEQASLYSAVVEGILEDIESSEGIQRKGIILSALTKLKQICNHPALFLQDASSLDGRSGKLSRLEEMLDQAVAAGDSSLIFTQFAAMGAMLRHHLQVKMGLEVLFLHGKTAKKKRDDMIARFQAGHSPVFILSLKAGGFGLNLTAANHVFHFDRWWNPAVENQATDRAFRIGQKKNVFVHKFVCLGTLEERIDQMIEQKKSLADSIIGSGESWLTELSDESLREMLSLRREQVSSKEDETEGHDQGGHEI